MGRALASLNRSVRGRRGPDGVTADSKPGQSYSSSGSLSGSDKLLP